MNEERNLTGYPSIDKPWLKYYEIGAEDKANDIPKDKTVWDVIEERLYKYIDIPAIEYFGRTITRKEFIDEVYLWAKVFKALEIKENEIVPYYGPLFPDTAAMTFALNIIGACPYFLKLAINSQALNEETKDSRIAIVFDDMWANVAEEFSKDRFSKIIIVKATDAMPSPLKQIVGLSQMIKNKSVIPKNKEDKKYICVKEAKQIALQYKGEVKCPFRAERNAFITSSSGTTIDGVVKGTVATNEATIAQLIMGEVSGIQYYPGDKCLNNLPPTASTSLNVMLFLALYKGLTVIIEPRVTEEDFYKQIIRYNPSIALTTGSFWQAFFDRIDMESKKGKTFDFSHSKGWTVGGEGTDVNRFIKWNGIVKKYGGKGIYSGYGQSELFSAACVELANARFDDNRDILSVGIPYAGITMGVFDINGNEVPYNTRGELWIKSKSAMKEYYNKPELTAQVKVDGWIHTGDLAEIDENGFVYILGRCNDKIILTSGKELYLFDIANKIREEEYIDDVVVLPISDSEGNNLLVAHLVWNDDMEQEEKRKKLVDIHYMLNEYLPKEVKIAGYAEHERMLPYSPTTLKKDKNKLSKQKTGYVTVVNGVLEEVSL